MSDVSPQTAGYSFVSLLGLALTIYGYWQKLKNTQRLKKAEKEIGPTPTAQDQLKDLRMGMMQKELDKANLLNEILRQQLRERDEEITRLGYQLMRKNEQLMQTDAHGRRPRPLLVKAEIVPKKHQTEE